MPPALSYRTVDTADWPTLWPQAPPIGTARNDPHVVARSILCPRGWPPAAKAQAPVDAPDARVHSRTTRVPSRHTRFADVLRARRFSENQPLALRIRLVRRGGASWDGSGE